MTMLTRAALVLTLLLIPLAAQADPVCIPHTLTVTCVLEGNESGCDPEDLPPDANWYLEVDADQAGIAYLIIISRDQSARLERMNIQAGANRLPATGHRSPNPKGNLGVMVITSTEPLTALDAFLDLTILPGSEELDDFRATVRALVAEHGDCTKVPEEPPTPESLPAGDSKGDDVDDLDFAPDDAGAPPDSGDNVHVEPELLD